jgi:hypothetical protein
MTTKEQLASNIVGHWDFRTGSLADQSGNGNDASISTSGPYWSNTKVGRAMGLTGTSGLIKVDDATNIQNIFDGGGTVFISSVIEGEGQGGTGRIIDKDQATSSGWSVYPQNESAGFVKLTFMQRFSTTAGIWTTTSAVVQLGVVSRIVITYDSSSTVNTPTISINGVNAALSVTSAPVGTAKDDSGLDLYMGGNQPGARTFNGKLMDVALFDVGLSSQQISQLYNDASQEAHLNKIPTKTVLPVRSDSEPKLLHWQKPINGKAIDVSGNGNDSLPITAIHTKDSIFSGGFLCNGASVIETENTLDLSAENQITVSCWFKAYDTNVGKNILEFSANFNSQTNAFVLSTSGGTITAGYKDAGGYTTRDTSFTVASGAVYFIVATYDRTQSGADIVQLYVDTIDVGVASLSDGTGGGFFGNHDLYVGSRAGTSLFLNGVVEDIRVYSGIMESSTRTSLYNEGRSKLGFYCTGEDWNVTPSAQSSGYLSNTPLKILSGSHNVVVTENNKKGVECATDGFLSVPIDSFFGELKFKAYNAISGGTIGMYISDGELTGAWNGYGAVITGGGDEAVISKVTSGAGSVLGTGSAISVGQTHVIKLTRNSAGLMRLFVDDVEEVSVTNTAYSSGARFLFFNLDAGDIISEVRFSPIIFDPTA